MSYVSARGQVERGPGESDERPTKRARVSGSNAETAPDAHAKPPDAIKSFYKRYQRYDKYEIARRLDLADCDVNSKTFTKHLVKQCTEDLPTGLETAFSRFLGTNLAGDADGGSDDRRLEKPPTVYQLHNMPGLFIYPNLLPQDVQISLLDKLLHRDLSNPEHQTNVHLHFNVPYPQSTSDSGEPGSFFDSSAATLEYKPKATHSAIDTQKLLDKKLRWITLGGQYDWSNKVYPAGTPPAFPPDIKGLVEDIFPMNAEAAIVNLYTPGETLSVHRDVSEECAQPLVSISLGCEAVFIAALEGADSKASNQRIAPIRLRSGDAVLMSGESRYAWHGVPKVLPDMCPEWLQVWPAIGSEENKERFKAYKGWLKGKRINLNVRQMFAGAGPDDEPEVGDA
ncbi:hypothetical protein LTR85_002539 [Meristemomyces frigidus]|nr:hypothetical protein LTR85_002539 [Meristemomyces frigidus]